MRREDDAFVADQPLVYCGFVFENVKCGSGDAPLV